MKRKNVVRVLLVVAAAFVFTGCAEARTPDYSDPTRWLALPSYTSMDADIFYLYPTVCTAGAGVRGIEDESMMEEAQAVFERQIPVFEEMGDVYAPYYSQAAGYSDSLSPEERRKLVSGAPKRDVFAAFDYYMENYNLGRPFILVGSCQGAELLLHLLSEYMRERPHLYGRMRAACLTGCTVPEEYLRANPHLRFARLSDGEGFVVSYAGNVSAVPGSSMEAR